jgi:beta-aspartyl-peptidase (threonine type)
MTRRGAVLVVHGGAGKAADNEADRREGERALAAALAAGWAILRAGGPSLDAVEVAVAHMEASGCFNAGRGAVADRDGGVSLDATIADGRTRTVGAVAAVTRVASAIAAARLVKERTTHVLLAGPAADAFALRAGALPAAPGTFLRARASEAGTVGAVARDAAGALAAATSTGGLAGKLPGRVGDSALLGAGTWADDRCAVSATGSGEHFIRAAFASDVARSVARLGLSLDAAVTRGLAEVVALGGHGGCVALDDAGNVAMPFSTAAMYRGLVDGDGPPRVASLPGELLVPPST